MTKEDKSRVTFNLNGTSQTVFASQIRRFSDVLREDFGLTGTHVSCEIGVCGVCTVLMNGKTCRSCLTFAIQADGSEVKTVLPGEEGNRKKLRKSITVYNIHKFLNKPK